LKLHIHTGPGRHEKILLDQLKQHNLDFSYTLYHPRYEFGFYNNDNRPSPHTSRLYNNTNWVVWGIKNRIPFLKKKNWQYDITYSLYDKITASKLNECDLFFGWPQMSLNCFKKVKKIGGVTILDYPIPHITTWQQLLLEESRIQKIKQPHSLFTAYTHKRMLKEIEETDFISVPSSFVKNSFLENGVPESKLLFNSYGIDNDKFHPFSEKPAHEKFTIIFVGSVELRKGVHYLLKSFNELQLKNCELKLVGNIHHDFKPYCDLYKSNNQIKWLGGQSKDKTAEEMRKADIMVMPSLLEGLSLTILECMASGTPVISSENAGGLDLIEDGKNGFIFPIRNTDKLKEKIEWCYHNRDKLSEMGKICRNIITETYSTDEYGKRSVNNIKKVARSKLNN